jgi:UDP-glucose 4-epimerase
MTRFLLSLDQAVDTIFAAVKTAKAGETYIPRVPSARVTDIAAALIGKQKIDVQITGIRPGEKTHEILVSEEERFRTVERGECYAILPILPELRLSDVDATPLADEYSSANDLMTLDRVTALLREQKLMPEDAIEEGQELLR